MCFDAWVCVECTCVYLRASFYECVNGVVCTSCLSLCACVRVYIFVCAYDTISMTNEIHTIISSNAE